MDEYCIILWVFFSITKTMSLYDIIKIIQVWMNDDLKMISDRSDASNYNYFVYLLQLLLVYLQFHHVTVILKTPCCHPFPCYMYDTWCIFYWSLIPPAKYWAWLSGSILCVYDCNPGINGPASWLGLTRIYGAWDATWYRIWQRIKKYQSEIGMVKPSKVWDEITTTSQISIDAQLKF